MDTSTFKSIQDSARPLRPQNALAAGHLMIDVGLLALAIWLATQSNFILWLLGEGLLFTCLWRTFSLFHTAAHNAHFEERILNRILGWYASVVVLVPFEGWKKSHLEHHRWAGSDDKDPSLALPREADISPFLEKALSLCWKFHIPIFAGVVTSLKRKEKFISLSDVFVFGIHLLLILSFKLLYVKVFIFPYFLFLFTTDFLTISQHNMTGHKVRGDEFPLPLHRHDEVTRELKFPKWVGQHVFLNFDLHLLHHMTPQTPHYHLRKIPYENVHAENWWKWCLRVHRLPGKKVYLER